MTVLDDHERANMSDADGFKAESQGSEAKVPPMNITSSATFFEPLGGQDAIPIPGDLLRRHNILVLKVKGNSMIEDNLFDRDRVIVENRGAAREGELVVAVIRNREATLRRFHCHEGRIRLESPNPSHKTMIFDEKDVAIQGVVVGILRRYTG